MRKKDENLKEKTEKENQCTDENLNEDMAEQLHENEEESSNFEDTKTEELTEDIQKKLEDKEKEAQEYLEMLKRTMADFDNYRKRAAKEKEGLYDEGFADAFKVILPILDNMERALGFKLEDESSIIQGVEMVLRMFRETLVKSGVEEIPAEGQSFDPDMHNAVMHIEDENYSEKAVVEVFQKGYKYKDKILRYSMVKVAN